MPFLLPNIINAAQYPEWLNFTDSGQDLSVTETLSLSLILFQQLEYWIESAWHNPCDLQPVANGAVRVILTCHKRTPDVVTLVFALAEFLVMVLSWGGKEVTYDFGVGTSYTHEDAQGTFDIRMTSGHESTSTG